MKLLSCYIEGYGKIKGQTVAFSEGITSFCKQNGEGKTTLASFIKAMFYGLKGYRKGSTEFCDREHFYPFEGGLFGGNITFTHEGNTYKIERFFGDKSETADTLRVFKNDEETTELGDEPGKTVFGLDKESFERTAFLDGGEVEIASTSGIHTRLNHFVEGGDEENYLDDALASLDKAAKVYKKSRVGADKVSVETARITRLNEEIANALAVKNALEGKYARERALKEEIESLSKEIISAQRQNEKLSQKEHYDSLVDGVRRAEKTLKEVEEKYPLGIPALEEIEKLNAYLVGGKELEMRFQQYAFSTADEEKLNALSAQFSNGVPSFQTLSEQEAKIQALAEIEGGIKLAESKTLTDREKALTVQFANRGVKEKISLAAEKAAEYARLKRAYDETPAFLPSEGKKGGRKYVVFAVLAAILLVVGGVVALFNLLVGGVLLGVAFIGLVLDGFTYLNQKSAQNGKNEENPKRRQLELAYRQVEDDLKAILIPLGYRSEHGVSYDFSLLQSDFSAYQRLCEEEELRVRSLSQNRGRAATLAQELTAFFADYGLEGAPFVSLHADLRSCAKEYAEWSARKAQSGEMLAKIRAEMMENQEKITAFQRKYGLKELLVGEMTEDARAATRLKKEILEGREKALAFKAAKGLDEGLEFVNADMGTLQALLQEKQEEKSRLIREIDEDERIAEKLDGYETDKAEAEGLLKAYKQKHRLLAATAEFMQAADGRLKDKYVEPIKSEFLHYAELIERALGEKVVMTKNFELRFERRGIERSERHLSSGQRSICSLCFRLALLKNMYRGELPFLVLDDPFTSLDAEHFAKVAEVLKALSKDTQMIYFTCHESRKI